MFPTNPAIADPVPDGAQITPRLPGANTPRSARPLQSASAEARWRTQNALLPTARELARQATAAGSDLAGVRLDLAAGVVHLYRTQPERGLRLPAGFAAQKVAVHPAKFSRGAMNAAMDAVTRDADLLADGKVAVSSVAPNLDGSGITVTVVGDSSAATALLRSRYGGVVATVNAVAAEGREYFAGGRFNDASPWKGGDRITDFASGCTTGFAANLGTQPVVITAAHCGGTGTTFYNGPDYQGNYVYMGQSVQSNGDTDIGAISVPDSFPFVQAGPAENSFQMLVLGWGTPIVGQTVCQSGSYTGEVCQLEIVDSGVRWCTRRNIFGKCKQWAGPFADAINLAGPGVPAAGHGDSGAPVYEFGAPSAGAGNGVGLVHGQLTSNAAASFPDFVPDTLWCDAPEGPSARCSSGFSFAHLPGY